MPVCSRARDHVAWSRGHVVTQSTPCGLRGAGSGLVGSSTAAATTRVACPWRRALVCWTSTAARNRSACAALKESARCECRCAKTHHTPERCSAMCTLSSFAPCLVVQYSEYATFLGEWRWPAYRAHLLCAAGHGTGISTSTSGSSSPIGVRARSARGGAVRALKGAAFARRGGGHAGPGDAELPATATA